MNILQSYRLAATAALLILSGTAFAQNGNLKDPAAQVNPNGAVNATWQNSLVTDGVYDHVPHVTDPLPWQPVREIDIMWKKRVWREIDTREKQNVAFRYPGDENTGGGYFIEILLDAIKRGKIQAYSTLDDRFTSTLTKEQVMDLIIGKSDTEYVTDPITGDKVMKVIHHDFNPDLITKYRIKEDVYFDRNLGRMVTRIIGIAPFMDIYNNDGTYRASQPLFWLYYPNIRDLLAQYEVVNPQNDVARMTWNDYFEEGFFQSHVVKVSNPFDATFKDMGATNMEALYDGKEAEQMLFNKEHDMWVY